MSTASLLEKLFPEDNPHPFRQTNPHPFKHDNPHPFNRGRSRGSVRSYSTFSLKSERSRYRHGHQRACSSYSQIEVPALPEEQLSDIDVSTKPRTVWTDIDEFHEFWEKLSSNCLHDALLIFPGIQQKWILEPEEFVEIRKSMPSLRSGNLVAFLQWKHAQGTLHCASTNSQYKQFWDQLNQKLTKELSDPSEFGTEYYNAVILDEAYYDSPKFCPQFGGNKQDIIGMLRGEKLAASTIRVVIKEVLCQSISTLNFVSDCCSLSDVPSFASSYSSRSVTAEDDVDLSEDEFLESLISDGLSDGFPSTFPDTPSDDEYVSERTRTRTGSIVSESGSIRALRTRRSSTASAFSITSGMSSVASDLYSDAGWVQLTPLSEASDRGVTPASASELSSFSQETPNSLILDTPLSFDDVVDSSIQSDKSSECLNHNMMFHSESQVTSPETVGYTPSETSGSPSNFSPLTDYHGVIDSRKSLLSEASSNASVTTPGSFAGFPFSLTQQSESTAAPSVHLDRSPIERTTSGGPLLESMAIERTTSGGTLLESGIKRTTSGETPLTEHPSFADISTQDTELLDMLAEALSPHHPLEKASMTSTSSSSSSRKEGDIRSLRAYRAFESKEKLISFQSTTSAGSSSAAWPMPRTASQEAEDQMRFCTTGGIDEPEGPWNISEVYYDGNSSFMRTADEQTRAFPLSHLAMIE